MTTPQDRIHRSKTETLLGERGVKADHAVRFRDLKGLVQGFDAEEVRRVAREVATTTATEVAEGYDGAAVELVASNSITVGNFSPSSTGSGAHSQLNEVWATKGNSVFVVASAIPISEWLGITKTYIVTAGMTGTVTALGAAAPDVYWGWTAEVLPLTRWEGDQTVRIRFDFWSRRVQSVANCVLTWKLYEVS